MKDIPDNAMPGIATRLGPLGALKFAHYVKATSILGYARRTRVLRAVIALETLAVGDASREIETLYSLIDEFINLSSEE